jgi:cis-3-alkyl-4-acyloxetan-2-one decarboxylase
VVTWNELPEAVKKHYPWPGEHLVLSTGHKLHYLDQGQGPTLLMVHGNPTWSFYWRTLVQGLSDTYRCVVPDHLGAGLSDKPTDYPYRLEDHIRNLVELIDHLDLKNVTLLVHDWGGPIGLGAAVERPDRIARLVIFNTSVFMEHVPLRIRLSRWKGIGELAIQGLNGFVRGGLLTAIGDRSRMKDGVGQGYLAPYDSWGARVGHLAFIRDIPLEEGHPTRAVIDRLTEQVPKLLGVKPTLFFWGDKDFVFTPRFLERWQKWWPNAEAVRYADAAHWVVEDAHERIVPKLREWLDQHPLPKS